MQARYLASWDAGSGMFRERAVRSMWWEARALNSSCCGERAWLLSSSLLSWAEGEGCGMNGAGGRGGREMNAKTVRRVYWY